MQKSKIMSKDNRNHVVATLVHHACHHHKMLSSWITKMIRKVLPKMSRAYSQFSRMSVKVLDVAAASEHLLSSYHVTVYWLQPMLT